MAHEIKALLTIFDQAYRAKFGEAYPVNPGKDTALAKRLVGLYGVDKLSRWIDVFFSMPDPFIEQSGYGFGVFSACLSKVIAYDKGQRPSERLTPFEQRQKADAVRYWDAQRKYRKESA